MPLLRKTNAREGHRCSSTYGGGSRDVSSTIVPEIGSQRLGDALESCATRRAQYLRCAGMHTDSVQSVVKAICEGRVRGPGVAYIAPALYDGIPEFLDKTMDALAELAVYASLYMGLVAVAGMSGYFPLSESVNAYYNGVFASMFGNTAVVMIAVIFRLAAVGHLRDSDKLLYLWRARYVPLFALMLFLFACTSTIVTLMFAVNDSVENGSACFAAAGDPTMGWGSWYGEWIDKALRPIGAGVMHPKGEEVLNPWILKANELNITWVENSVSHNQDTWDQYSEFMRDHFGFSQSCHPRALWQWMIPYLVIGVVIPLLSMLFWIAPTRHIFNYLTAQPAPACERYSLGFLGGITFSFYMFGPLAHDKIDDPFDLTEAWEEFKLRAAVGLELAKKDKKDTAGDGFVSLKENEESHQPTQQDLKLPTVEGASSVTHAWDPSDLGTLLKTIGLGGKYAAVANEIELEELRALAQRNDAACLSELKDAGVSVGDRIKITNALVNGL